jgi:hypothetical protein
VRCGVVTPFAAIDPLQRRLGLRSIPTCASGGIHGGPPRLVPKIRGKPNLRLQVKIATSRLPRIRRADSLDALRVGLGTANPQAVRDTLNKRLGV